MNNDTCWKEFWFYLFTFDKTVQMWRIMKTQLSFWGWSWILKPWCMLGHITEEWVSCSVQSIVQASKARSPTESGLFPFSSAHRRWLIAPLKPLYIVSMVAALSSLLCLHCCLFLSCLAWDEIHSMCRGRMHLIVLTSYPWALKEVSQSV